MFSKKVLGILLIPLIVFSILSVNRFLARSATAEPNCNAPGPGDYDYCYQKLQGIIDALTPAQETNEKDLAGLRTQLSNIENTLNGISSQLDQTSASIAQREEDLAFAQKIFEEKATSDYKFIRLYDPILPFLSADDASQAFEEVNFRQKAIDEDRKTMEKYVGDLSQLKTDQENLQKNQASLASLQAQVASKEKFLAGEVAKTAAVLAELSAQQQNLIALKSGGFQTSVGDTPPTQDPCSGPPGSQYFCDPGFRSAFAAFSFGAPHRTGLSQYGAYGRSKMGQSAEQILAAYFQGADLNKSYSEPDNITVSGYGSISFEDNYLLGIYEVPESWGDSGGFEALKAQAVAARSYALAVTNNGQGSICPDESCQVYSPNLKSGKWADAVRATRGWVMTKGGTAATTYYASTAGGFTISQWGWTGIKDVANDDWPNQAYEKIAGSPWFYKAWYRTRAGDTCGKSGPWLTSQEMADILNAWVVLTNGNGDKSRISPIDTDCWGGNPYSMSDLVSIGGFSDVYSASVIYANDGSTQSVTFSTNKGATTVSGSDFKSAFNLRAPGYIGLKSSLFNIEKL